MNRHTLVPQKPLKVPVSSKPMVIKSARKPIIAHAHFLRAAFNAWRKLVQLRLRLKKGVRILRRVKRSMIKAHYFSKWKNTLV